MAILAAGLRRQKSGGHDGGYSALQTTSSRDDTLQRNEIDARIELRIMFGFRVIICRIICIWIYTLRTWNEICIIYRDVQLRSPRADNGGKETLGVYCNCDVNKSYSPPVRAARHLDSRQSRRSAEA